MSTPTADNPAMPSAAASSALPPGLRPRLAGPILVCGHACLDLIPAFGPGSAMPAPGELLAVGSLTFSGGGAVPNVGLTIGKLGFPARVVCSVGSDFLGATLQSILREGGADVRVRVVPDGSSSYSIVLAPPGSDRSFLHHPGINHCFDPHTDVSDDDLRGVSALHFGYPPAMNRTLTDGGESLAALLQRAQAAGAVTSLDFCRIAPASYAAGIDWRRWLSRVLPHVSLFCPSLDETRAALGSSDQPERLADELLALGAAVVVLKLGDHGLICRSSPDPQPLSRSNLPTPARWTSLSLRQRCFEVQCVSAVGAGDATIAGLLVAAAGGLTPADCLRMACAVGAGCVEHATATGGIRPWDETVARVEAGWPTFTPPHAHPQ